MSHKDFATDDPQAGAPQIIKSVPEPILSSRIYFGISFLNKIRGLDAGVPSGSTSSA